MHFFFILLRKKKEENKSKVVRKFDSEENVLISEGGFA